MRRFTIKTCLSKEKIMQIVNVQQGTPEWFEHRAQSLNASDAPAMMGVSPYKTRDQLIKEMATGIMPEVDEATQRRFDDGHRFEALAREKAEQIVGEELFPVVGYINVDTKHGEKRLSASFDGLTLMGDVAFEHKTLNAALRGCATSDGKKLPIQYRVQMEQQLAVSGAEKVLFVASKWDDDSEMIEPMLYVWYFPDLALRKEIMEGWAKLLEEVEQYTPAEAVEVLDAPRKPDMLPALNVQVSGVVVSSNLEPFKEHALSVIAEINTTLETDQDFADAEATVGWLKKDVAARLKATKDACLAQAADIEAVFRTIDSVIEAADKKRLQLEKLVKARKDQIKEEIVMAARNELRAHYKKLNDGLPHPFLLEKLGGFAEVVKGKRSISSMQAAVNEEMLRCKEIASADAYTAMGRWGELTVSGKSYEWLFPDFAALLEWDGHTFSSIVTSRINQSIEREKHAEEPVRDIAAPEPASEVPIPAPESESKEDGKMLNLGEINRRLSPITLTADGLAQLGFHPAAKEKTAKLYRASEFQSICAALVRHIRAAQG